jgi:hypothetical protein
MSSETGKPDSGASRTIVNTLEKKKHETPLKRIKRMQAVIETKPDSLPDVSSKHSSHIPYDELNIDITQKFSKITRAVNSNSPKRDDRMPLGQI